MRKLYFLFACVTFACTLSHAQISLTALNSPYSQNFNTLASTGTGPFNTLPAGWLLTESGGGAQDDEMYVIGNGSSNSGNSYSFGTTASTDRALGGVQLGSVIPTIGAAFINNTGSTITTLTITYTGEQWRLGTTGRQDRLDFQYSLNASSLATGAWTDINAGDFSSPNTSSAAGLLDGNVAG